MRAIDFTLSQITAARELFMAARVQELMSGDDLTREEAEEYAADEWAPKLRAEAPNCWSCEFIGPVEHDPYGTGDSPAQRECTVFECPWGKR